MTENHFNSNKVRYGYQQKEYHSNSICQPNIHINAFHCSSDEYLLEKAVPYPSKPNTSHSDEIEVVEMDLSMIKEELEDVAAEEKQPKNLILNLHHWHKKKMKSVQSFKQFMWDCSFIFPRKEKKNVRGPVWLVVCPKCFAVYKNYPDRLIRLYNHVIKRHSKNQNMYLKDIMRSCDQLIRFMVKTWKVKST